MIIVQYYVDGGWHDYCDVETEMEGIQKMIECAGTFATTKVRMVKLFQLGPAK